MTDVTNSAPTATPPAGAETAGGKAAATAPSQGPPTGVVAPPQPQASNPATALAMIGRAAAGKTAGGTWSNGQHVDALWSIHEDRNAWMSIQGVGWKKLSPRSESGIVALNALAANARVTQGQVSVREEDDGLVHELYVW
jgi:hypothetical protein